MKRIVIASLAVAIGAAVAYFGYGALQQRALRAEVTRHVHAAGVRLGATLGADVNAPDADIIERLDNGVDEIDANLQRLRAAQARLDPGLVEAADEYLGNALAVLRRQAGGARARVRFVESRKALADHMGHAAQRTGKWLTDAVQLRQQLDKDHYEYQLALTSLANMLAEAPHVRGRIAVRMPALDLPETAALGQARERALAAAAQTRREFEQAKQLVRPG
jgi:hypothetical protein